MTQTKINLNINVDANQLINQIGGIAERHSYNDRMLDNGKARFISFQSNGRVYSCVNHVSKNHTATATSGRIKQSYASSDAPPGVWAIAMVDSSPLGNDKTFYKWDD